MDTLEIVEILEEQGFSNKKAIKLAEAINGKSGLVTKEDIGFLREEVSEVKSALREEISEVKSALREEIGEVKNALREEVSEVKNALREEISEVKNDITVLKTSNKWVIAVLFLILSLLVKVAFFN